MLGGKTSIPIFVFLNGILKFGIELNLEVDGYQ